MYKSRYHYDNSALHIAVDSLTGELLELVPAFSGENLIKNSLHDLRKPFQIYGQKAGKNHSLFGGNVYEITRDPGLKPDISSEELPDGGIRVTVIHSRLTDGERSYQVSVKYTMELPAGKSAVLWQMEMDNHEDGLLIEDVRFPVVQGIYMGEKWQDDTLIYPLHAGLRVENPVEVFASPHRVVDWKWQEYRYGYELSNPASGPDENGRYFLEYAYSGPLSMTWLEYFGDGTGFYFANHDPEPRTCSLRAETCGPERPGMSFSFRHYLFAEAGQQWRSPQLVCAVHPGDWHEGAHIYRSFREQFERIIPPDRPEWFEKSPGVIAHYDFKYQNGGVVHRYEDIPSLLDEARDLGINHLLLSGWHWDGFDHGFPNYFPDPELGTEEELKNAIGNVTGRGGHVCFYINSRLANTKYDQLRDFIDENVVIRRDGTPHIENYGNADLSFGAMCINSAGWQQKLRDTLRYITEEVGVDGVYLDQLGMAPPGLCCAREHGHAPDRWNRSYQQLLGDVIGRRRESNPEQPMSIIHEGVSDSYGGYSSGQLISTFMYHHVGAFPELYAYTFPEQILVDMLYPEKNMAMRPVHVGQVSTAIMDRAFTTGFYYWIYDLVDDNTFTRDPAQYASLKKMVALRKFWLETFGRGLFRDQDGLEVWGNVRIGRFELEDGLLLACAREDDSPAEVMLPWNGEARVCAYDAEDGTVEERMVPWSIENGILQLELPAAKRSLVRILPDHH